MTGIIKPFPIMVFIFSQILLSEDKAALDASDVHFWQFESLLRKLLRYRIHPIEISVTNRLDNGRYSDCIWAENSCELYQIARSMKFDSFPHFFGRRYFDCSVTLILHASVDRLLLNGYNAIEHWTSCISLAVWVSADEVEDLARWYFDRGLDRRSVSVHVVPRCPLRFQLYPYNVLRNIAMREAQSEIVFIGDIDFSYSKSLSSEISKRRFDSQTVFVVPAFMAHASQSQEQSKIALMDAVHAGQIIVPSSCQACHEATNYSKFWFASSDYPITYNFLFEPFLAIHRPFVFFNESFVGYGYDKQQFALHLHILGYKFTVMHNAFMIHQPHPESVDLHLYLSTITAGACLKQFFLDYARELGFLN